MNGISAFIKEIPESSLILSTIWWLSEKTAVYKGDIGFLPDTKSADA